MAFQYKVGNFQLNTSTGEQSVTGLGFTPKGLLFFHTPDTVDIGSPDQVANLYGMVGMTDGTNERSQAWFSTNGAGTSDVYYIQDDANCIHAMINSTTQWKASLTSLDSDGFTINVGTAPGDTYRVGYLAYGGDDVTGVAVGTVRGRTTLGTRVVSGLGFQPTGLVAVSMGSDSAPSATLIRGGNASPSFGFSDGTEDRCATMFLQDSVTSSNCHRAQRDDAIIAEVTASSYLNACTVQSFDADGFTLNFTDNGLESYIFYLAFAGPEVAVGDVTMPTSISEFTETGLAFNPHTLITATSGQSAFGSISSNGDGAKYAYGFATASNQRFTIGGTAEDAQGTTDEDHHQHSLFMGRVFNFALTSLWDFDIVTLDEGGFTLNAETVQGSGAIKIGYMAIEGQLGGNDGGGGSGPGGGDGSNTFSSPFLQFFIGV